MYCWLCFGEKSVLIVGLQYFVDSWNFTLQNLSVKQLLKANRNVIDEKVSDLFSLIKCFLFAVTTVVRSQVCVTHSMRDTFNATHIRLTIPQKSLKVNFDSFHALMIYSD